MTLSKAKGTDGAFVVLGGRPVAALVHGAVRRVTPSREARRLPTRARQGSPDPRTEPGRHSGACVSSRSPMAVRSGKPRQ